MRIEFAPHEIDVTHFPICRVCCQMPKSGESFINSEFTLRFTSIVCRRCASRIYDLLKTEVEKLEK